MMPCSSRGVGRENHPRRIAPHARDAEQQAEELALDLRSEAVEQLRILAHDVVDVELRLLRMLDFRIGLERDVEVVAHPADVDNGVCRSEFRHTAAYIFVHGLKN